MPGTVLNSFKRFNVIQQPYKRELLYFAEGLFGIYILSFKNDGDDDNDEEDYNDKNGG